MTTDIDYALMAGVAYRSNRNPANRFPIPSSVGWSEISGSYRSLPSGFEAVAFQRGTEIVVSYAGTDSISFADLAADSALASGNWSDQLLEAAEYYLQIKAAYPAATITLTGHSLGGGLAALVAVFFGVQATTFDQAPFAFSALDFGNNNAADLRARLAAKLDTNGVRLYDDEALSGLTAYLQLRSDSAVSNNIPRSGLVDTIRVEGEFLDHGVLGASSIGNNPKLLDHGPGGSGFDLHSQALLAAFLQSNQSAPNVGDQKQSLSEATKKLTDALPMFFNTNLFATDPKSAEPNFLDRLVRHEAGVKDSFDADAMVTRFTSDLWKLAKDGGLTRTDKNPTNAELNFVSKTLVAFAMQMYYEDTANATNRDKQLFTEVTGGIRFDMADVSSNFAVAFQNGDKLNLADAKGFDLYFKSYLQQANLFTPEDGGLIQSTLPYMRDWYVQAGASGGLATTDTLNRGAFMLGGNGSDSLVGGSAADLLVGNADDDRLDGGAGIDTLLGGLGADTLIGGEGHDLLLGGADNDTYQFTGNNGLDIIRDTDGQIVVGAAPIYGGRKLADSVWTDDKQFTYALIEGNLVIRPSDASGVSGIITVKDWTSGQLSITLSDLPASSPVTPTSFIGDFVKKKNSDGTRYVLGEDGQYAPDGAQANAPDLITGTSSGDLIQGMGGDDALLGGDGADVVEGGAGNDVLMGGLGADTLKGGSDADLIYGSSSGELTYTLDVNYQIEQPNAVPIAEGFNWRRSSPGPDADGFQQAQLSNTVIRDMQPNDAGNNIDAGAGEEVVFAGTGKDVVPGGDDADDIFGMGGADLIFGDAGGDRIYGDGGTDPALLNSAAPETHGKDILVGGAGADLLIGQGNDDVLYGGENDDKLFGDYRNPIEAPEGFRGNDYLDGGAGNDTLNGNEGDDLLIGGTGTDILAGGLGRDVYILNKGDGKDTIYDSKSEGNVLRLGAGISSSEITLRRGSLMLDLGGGDEVHIEGFNAADAANSAGIESFEFADGSSLSIGELLERGFDVDGSALDDTLEGTSVTDRIRGFAGNDTLKADTGDDVLDGGEGDDKLYGFAGNDVLEGGAGSDELDGGEGDDQLSGGGGRDSLYGGTGNDTLEAGVGGDALHGGAGDDIYKFDLASGEVSIIDDAGINVVAFGEGIQQDAITVGTSGGFVKLSLGNGDAVRIEGTVAEYRFADGSVITEAELQARLRPPGSTRVDGTTVADTLTGTAGEDYVFAGDGNDTADGHRGNDVLFGGAGNDTLRGGTGADSLLGGLGNDAVLGDAGSDKLWGQAGDDSLFGGDGDDELTAGDGADLLVGGKGDDALISEGTGNKTYLFNAGDGTDVILSAGGTRRLKFGTGIQKSDIKMYRSTGDYVRVLYSAQDSAYIRLGYGDGAIEYEFADGSVVSHATLSSTAMQSQYAPGLIVGAEGDETLYVNNSGAITVQGLGGNDRFFVLNNFATVQLKGGSGNDQLRSVNRNDVLVGGAGNDDLNGGYGSDTYVYTLGDGNDVIEEFNSGTNVNILRLVGLNANDVTYSHESNDSLKIHVAATGETIEVLYWYDDPSRRLQQIVYDDGSQQDLAALQNLVPPVIVGTSGDDTLIGTAAAESILGGPGNDMIDSVAGDDLLSGGEGMDAYVLRRGMGLDTIQEVAGETNVLQLTAGLSFDQLVGCREGNDLRLNFTHAADGALLKDYFAGIGQWMVVAESGEQKSLDQAIAASAITAAPTTVAELRSRWIAEAKVGLLQSYVEDAVSAGNAYSYVQPTTLAIDYPYLGRVTYGFGEFNQTNNSAYVERAFSESQNTSGSPTVTTVTLPVTRYELIGSPAGSIILQDYGALDAQGQPKSYFMNSDGSFTVDTRLLPTTSTYGWQSTTEFVTVTVRSDESNQNTSEIFEHITAGAGNNFILSWGMGTVDSGAGNDVVLIDGGYGNDYPGQFLHGGTGDDILLGGYSDDMLVGGDGNDYLAGGQGDETYEIRSSESGIKIVDEVSYGWIVPQVQLLSANGGGRYSTDTVQFGAGLSVEDLQVRRGRYQSPYAAHYAGGWIPDSTVFDTLDFSWGSDHVVRVLLAEPTEPSPENDGAGIEFFKFANGSTLSLAEMEAIIEQRNGSALVLWKGDGVVMIPMPPDVHSLKFGPGIAPEGVTVGRSGMDLVLSAGTDRWTLQGWYGNPDNLRSCSAEFENGTAWDASFFRTGNTAPSLTAPIADQAIAEDETWTLPVTAAFTDGDVGDTLTYTARTSDGGALPAWLAFDADSGLFSGIPLNSEVGEFGVMVTATDGAGETVSDSFTVTIHNTNDVPVLAQPVGDQAAVEDVAWSFTFASTTFGDVDAGDKLSYSVIQADGRPLAAWLSFDTATRTLSGTPLNADVGQLTLKVTATDKAGAAVSDTFNLTITNVNDSPVVAESLADQTAFEDALWSLSVPAGTFADVDADDVLAYSATLADGSPLPNWLSFDAQSRSFRGVPLNGDVGQLSLRVAAIDLAGSTASVTFNVDVTNVNDAPLIAQAISEQEAVEDQPWVFAVPAGTFIDEDRGDALTYTAQLEGGGALPAWLEFDATTATFTGMPLNDDVGTLRLEVSATDRAGERVSANIALSVKNVNDAPVAVGSLNNWAVKSGSSALYPVPDGAFADVDLNDSLKFSANLADGSALPSWLGFDQETRTLNANPTISVGGYSTVVVTATDLAGQSASHTLSLRVDLELAGSTGKDVLTGAAGNDRLDGGADADRLRGGRGDDTYIVDNRGDVVTELGGEGFDTVRASVDYALAAHVEALVLTGGKINLDGTGNASDNAIVGTGGKNKLAGADGNDVLDGGAGDDILEGGAGGDTYLYGRGYEGDTLIEDDATAGNSDLVLFGAGIAADQLWFRKHGNSLEASIIGTADTLTVKQWFKSQANHVEVFTTTDGKILLESQVQSLVDVMAAFDPPAAGQTTLPPDYQRSLAGVIAASWQ
jgi:Ca2+-binding RTX toxin-like protein